MLRAALLTLLILIVLPAAANAACRTAPDAAVRYESPHVQIWQDGPGLAVCDRATQAERLVRAEEDYEAIQFGGVDGGDRWLYYSTYVDDETPGAARPYSSDVLLDLVTGDTLSENGEEWVPGGELVFNKDGLVAYYIDGRREVLDPVRRPFFDDYARQGRRIYWQTAKGPKTALLHLPDVGPRPARPLPKARRMAGCTPGRGARLVVRFRGMVVTRKGTDTRVCWKGRTTRLGDATRVEPLSGHVLAYTRPGSVGRVDAVTGRTRELPRGKGGLAAAGRTIAARDRTGVLRSWSDVGAARLLTTARATAVAVSDERVYWLAADGTPRSAAAR
jgi:hypothetical protein